MKFILILKTIPITILMLLGIIDCIKKYKTSKDSFYERFGVLFSFMFFIHVLLIISVILWQD